MTANESNLLCVVDTETTGLPDNPEAAVVEVALTIWDVKRQAEIRSWSTLVKPPTWSEDGRRVVREISGFDPDLIDEHGIEPMMGLMRALDFAGRLPLHAWNLPFDEEFVRRMAPSERRLSQPGRWGPCLMREFSTLSRGSPDLRSKLTYAYEQCGFDVPTDAHRALTDAKMAARAICHIRNGGTLSSSTRSPARARSEPEVKQVGRRKWTPIGVVDTAGRAP